MGVNTIRKEIASGVEFIPSEAEGRPRNDSWLDNPDVQRLLDVVAEIIADEYIEVAKTNKEVFEIASPRPSVGTRNDSGDRK